MITTCSCPWRTLTLNELIILLFETAELSQITQNERPIYFSELDLNSFQITQHENFSTACLAFEFGKEVMDMLLTELARSPIGLVTPGWLGSGFCSGHQEGFPYNCRSREIQPSISETISL